jgi:hypothetical protein
VTLRLLRSRDKGDAAGNELKQQANTLVFRETDNTTSKLRIASANITGPDLVADERDVHAVKAAAMTSIATCRVSKGVVARNRVGARCIVTLDHTDLT